MCADKLLQLLTEIRLLKWKIMVVCFLLIYTELIKNSFKKQQFLRLDHLNTSQVRCVNLC